MLPLSALLGFICVVLLVLRGKGPMAAASILLFVHAPLMIGIFAAVQGLISSYSIIATSAATPKPSDVAAGFSTALFAPVVALLLMIPSYSAAAIGTFVRAVFVRDESTDAPSSM
ncbi:putative membrane protein [Rhodopirellula maiorica SM1]|uniref:Putative membrane protein n=1 Tax=Rhodopirellula maiorica SM1 TaxID=1265738 RepID=M5RFS9_9BACT|nr:putative membrane protein [Rhodopirellula maiorica SM1]